MNGLLRIGDLEYPSRLAAKRAGIRQVIVPKRNEKDLPDIPEEVKKTVKFHFVENIDQVMHIALAPPIKSAKSERKVGKSKA